MEVKMDLAAMIRMMVTSQNEGIEQAIEQSKKALETAEKGLDTSYERLEEAKAEHNMKNIFTIESYISYLENCIPAYYERAARSKERIGAGTCKGDKSYRCG